MTRAPYVRFTVRARNPGRAVNVRDIVAAVIEEIGAGRLPAGCRVPPVRAIERQLGISRNTVHAAYEMLVERGYLETRPRAGVFVAPRSGDAPAAVRVVPPLPALRPRRPLAGEAHPSVPIPLSEMQIEIKLAPRGRIAECVRSALRRPSTGAYDHQGDPALREAVAARLRARGMDVHAREVVLTTGSQQAIDLVARVLQVRRVALEDPVFAHARRVFESHDIEVTPLPFDPFAPLPLADWEARLAAARPSLLYAITSFQNPTGYSYSTNEQMRVLELARAHGFAILEDDWGSDMLSGSEYRPTLRTLGGPSVLYVNSFSKKVLPGLRLGFVVAHEDLVPAIVHEKRLSILGGVRLIEAAMADFVARGYYDAHLTSLQRELDARYRHCLEALRALMPADVRWTTPGGGPSLWLDLPRSVDLAALAAHLGERGVGIDASNDAFLGEPHLHGFPIGYAYVPSATLTRGLELLAEALRRS